MTDRRLARMIDDHVTGRYHPDAPFNQREPLPEYKCLECEWQGNEPTEIKHTEASEHFGQVAYLNVIELRCPECKREDTVVPYDPEEDDDEGYEEDDEEEEDDDLDDDEEDETGGPL